MKLVFLLIMWPSFGPNWCACLYLFIGLFAINSAILTIDWLRKIQAIMLLFRFGEKKSEFSKPDQKIGSLSGSFGSQFVQKCVFKFSGLNPPLPPFERGFNFSSHIITIISHNEGIYQFSYSTSNIWTTQNILNCKM